MKNYRLKQWYPDIPSYMMEGFIVDYYDEEEKAIYTYPDGMRLGFKLPLHHLECRNFWELIEERKPLFVTEDGVDVVNGMRIHSVRKSNFDRDNYIVDEDFVKEQTSKHPYVYFFHESNADEYIWRNKRVFSYKDIQNYGVHPVNMIRVAQLAKERSEE